MSDLIKLNDSPDGLVESFQLVIDELDQIFLDYAKKKNINPAWMANILNVLTAHYCAFACCSNIKPEKQEDYKNHFVECFRRNIEDFFLQAQKL